MNKIFNLIAEEDRRQDILVADGRPLFVGIDSPNSPLRSQPITARDTTNETIATIPSTVVAGPSTRADEVTDRSQAAPAQRSPPSASNASTIANGGDGSGHQKAPDSNIVNDRAVGSVAQQIHDSRRLFPSQRRSRGALPATMREEQASETLMAVVESPSTYAPQPAPSLPHNLQASPAVRAASNGPSGSGQRARAKPGRNSRILNANTTRQNSSAPRANPPAHPPCN